VNGGKILTDEKHSTRWEISPSATLSTTNRTWAGLESDRVSVVKDQQLTASATAHTMYTKSLEAAEMSLMRSLCGMWRRQTEEWRYQKKLTERCIMYKRSKLIKNMGTTSNQCHLLDIHVKSILKTWRKASTGSPTEEMEASRNGSLARSLVGENKRRLYFLTFLSITQCL
jgi:hypothetical protein